MSAPTLPAKATSSASVSFTNRRWRLASSKEVVALSDEMHPVLARCLGYRLKGREVADWLRPDEGHFHDPYRMLGMKVAVDRLQRALRDRERIRIVTDYDVDGTTSSLILQHTLALLGGRDLIDYHIPHRFVEGYGFSALAARQAIEDGIKVIVTADIGVRDAEAIAVASDGGIDVIVCDHHLPEGEAVPDRAYTVLCPPQEGCMYPNKALAACGVSFKLAQAMLSGRPRADAILRSLLKMASIGTIADVVDLSTLENRAIVAVGLDQLRGGPHSPGLQSLLTVCGLDSGWLDSSDIAYRVSPRINAAGRLKAATTVVELFTERDPARAKRLADELDQLNEQRQRIERELVETCITSLPDVLPSFIVLSGREDEGWHRGVVGIVASRVRDRTHRPTAVIAVDGDCARASVRSTPEVHAVHALESVADLLDKYGGHPAAAGFSIATSKIEELSTRLGSFCDQDRLPEKSPELVFEAECAPEEVNWTFVRALRMLEPHGKGNPKPLLWLRGVRPRDIEVFKDKHIRFKSAGIRSIWWNGAQHAQRLHQTVDLAVEAGINRFRGRSSIQLIVKDAMPATEDD